MANPRKFSEKIALQKQRQQEGTAEFERIMKEVYATKMDETQANQKILECCLVNTDIGSNHTTNASLVSAAGIGGGGSGGGGGGGGVVNTADGGAAGNSGGAANATGSGSGGASPDGTHNSNSRESRGRSVGVGPMRRPSERKQDRSPYGSSAAVATGMNAGMSNNAYLSPPMDSSWRRSNSDSALHQTLNMAVAAEGGFGPGGGMGGMGDMSALHANYQHHNQRSHSPNIGRSFSPQAQRRKGQMLHHQQQQQQQQQHLHHSQQQLHLQQQHQQLQHNFQQQLQQQHMHQQQAQQQHVQQHHAQQPASSVSQQQQQHPQQFNPKYTNCNMPINSLFKSLQEQTLALANTGSLPDLTSLHYSPAQQQLLHQQQQQTLSPILSPHNNGRERDQSSSPFSPTGGNGVGGGPPSPYQQQQHSPTSAANTPTAAQTSPHLSFTNLAVQSPTGNGSNTQNAAQTGTFTNLPTLGGASSTGNLTEYRQPLNPPSPGSSPGLLTSVSGNDVVHISAPASPIRHPQAGMIGSSMQPYNEKNMQTFDRYSPALAGGAPENAGFNSLNSSFHNHFEQFTLGDSNSSPEQQQQLQQHFQQQRQQQQQQQQQNSFTTIDFEDFVSGGNGSPYSQSLTQSKQLDFSDLTGVPSSTATTTTQSSRGGNTNNGGNTSNNNNTHQATRILSHQMLNNNGAGVGNNTNSNPTTNGPCRISNNNVNLTQANEVNSSPIPSPLGCLPSPSSPLPIPINAQSPHHQHQQLSLSLHSHSAQPSPHHSPLHSPHHASPLSSSSPGITTLTSGVSPAQHMGGNGTNNASAHHNQHQQASQHHQQSQHQHQHHHHPHQQHHHHHQQNHANTPTNTNIPAIIFSDYSSQEIFDTLDLDLSQMDQTALDLLGDQNSIMIADPTIEDSFRKDLN